MISTIIIVKLFKFILLLLKVTRRNTHRAVVSFEPISSLKQNELWKVGCDEKTAEKTESKGESSAKRIRLSEDDDDIEKNKSDESQDMEM